MLSVEEQRQLVVDRLVQHLQALRTEAGWPEGDNSKLADVPSSVRSWLGINLDASEDDQRHELERQILAALPSLPPKLAELAEWSFNREGQVGGSWQQRS